MGGGGRTHTGHDGAHFGGSCGIEVLRVSRRRLRRCPRQGLGEMRLYMDACI